VRPVPPSSARHAARWRERNGSREGTLADLARGLDWGAGSERILGTAYSTLAAHDLETLRLLSLSASRETPPVDVSDWKCTLMFYTTADLLPITSSYRKLEEFSREARCEGRRFRPVELQTAFSWFLDVHNHIDRLLHTTGVSPVPVIDPSPYL